VYSYHFRKVRVKPAPQSQTHASIFCENMLFRGLVIRVQKKKKNWMHTVAILTQQDNGSTDFIVLGKLRR
jgi:hypothetical protein